MAELKTDLLLDNILNRNDEQAVFLEEQPVTLSSSDGGVPNSEAGDVDGGGTTSSSSAATSADPQPHVCYLCGLEFSCRTYVNRHIKNVHAEINEHHNKCPKCPMTFQRYDTFWEHVVKVHENPGGLDDLLPPPQPGKKIDESDVPLVVPETEAEIEALVDSLVSKEDERTCLRCQKQLCDRRHVRRHIREVHLRLRLPGHKSVECEYCHKTFVNNSVYQAHKRNIHLNPVPTMPCPRCIATKKLFKDVKGLRRHLREVHRLKEDEVNKLAPIPTANTTEKAKVTPPSKSTELKIISIQGQDGDVVYTCTTCDISFVTSDALNRHNKNCHGMAIEIPRPRPPPPAKRNLEEASLKEYKCKKCGKCFNTRNGLRGHAVVHQKANLEKPMKNMLRVIFGQLFSSTSLTCGICKEVVSTSIEGRLHVYIKHPEKYEELVTRPAELVGNGLLQCENCEEKRGSEEEMIKHIEQSHEEVYVPTCGECGLKELKERDMNLHYKRYHPEKSRYVCEVCKVGFMQKREMMYHYTREHRGDSVECPYCGERHVKVKLHVTVKHPERAGEYAEMRRKVRREEEEGRKRFNRFLEKGVMEGKVGRGRYKSKRRGDGGEGEDDEKEGDGGVNEVEGKGEIEDRKVNICFVRETEKVVIPEQYKIKKNESRPHVIEVERLPRPSTPTPPPQTGLEEEEEMGGEDEEEAVDLDNKPDVNELEKSIGENCGEKMVVIRLTRLTEEEIGKWTTKRRIEVDEGEEEDEDGEVDTLCKVTKKTDPSTWKRGRRRGKKRKRY